MFFVIGDNVSAIPIIIFNNTAAFVVIVIIIDAIVFVHADIFFRFLLRFSFNMRNKFIDIFLYIYSDIYYNNNSSFYLYFTSFAVSSSISEIFSSAIIINTT